jgi:sulfite exporter TauE/SafE
MCGPIAMTLAAKDRSRFAGNKLAYNLGRTLTYATLGALIGLIGFSLALTGFQQFLSLFMGVVIVVMALLYKKSERIIAGSGIFGGMTRLKLKLGKYLKKGGSQAYFVSGLLNGLLPCGMVYIALVATLALQSAFYGFLYMLFFGLGTIPVMLTLMFSKDLLGFRLKQRISRALPYFAMFIGVLFIVRGMGLGIHYISPKVDVEAVQGAAESGIVEMTLCD